MGLEDAHLLVGGEASVEGEDFCVGGVVFAEGFGGFADFAFAGEEDEDIPGGVALEFVGGGEDGIL